MPYFSIDSDVIAEILVEIKSPEAKGDNLLFIYLISIFSFTLILITIITSYLKASTDSCDAVIITAFPISSKFKSSAIF
ncbi:hypothetical protein SKUN_00621 [Spiroplasma kunkelii CR2-3x]|uniref:Uncharacterized protein n=1 Tax=Spiroplasma kunkelii CR2-3x TaxID=273035 RepID=A0A0K2JFZ4_SPIKU|nr:hypothetical protein [Spiroplasma kunkelii]ALA97514.1 hypothetical protein SKUN_00621 [Spiroplasma kunkelii CR2-3x]